VNGNCRDVLCRQSATDPAPTAAVVVGAQDPGSRSCGVKPGRCARDRTDDTKLFWAKRGGNPHDTPAFPAIRAAEQASGHLQQAAVDYIYGKTRSHRSTRMPSPGRCCRTIGCDRGEDRLRADGKGNQDYHQDQDAKHPSHIGFILSAYACRIPLSLVAFLTFVLAPARAAVFGFGGTPYRRFQCGPRE